MPPSHQSGPGPSCHREGAEEDSATAWPLRGATDLPLCPPRAHCIGHLAYQAPSPPPPGPVFPLQLAWETHLVGRGLLLCRERRERSYYPRLTGCQALLALGVPVCERSQQCWAPRPEPLPGLSSVPAVPRRVTRSRRGAYLVRSALRAGTAWQGLASCAGSEERRRKEGAG